MKHQEDKKIQVRFPLDIWEAMRALAQEHERSFNGEVIWALRSYLSSQKAETHHGKKGI